MTMAGRMIDHWRNEEAKILAAQALREMGRHECGPYCDCDVTDTRFDVAMKVRDGDHDHLDADGDPMPFNRYMECREID